MKINELIKKINSVRGKRLLHWMMWLFIPCTLLSSSLYAIFNQVGSLSEFFNHLGDYDLHDYGVYTLFVVFRTALLLVPTIGAIIIAHVLNTNQPNKIKKYIRLIVIVVLWTVIIFVFFGIVEFIKHKFFLHGPTSIELILKIKWFELLEIVEIAAILTFFGDVFNETFTSNKEDAVISTEQAVELDAGRKKELLLQYAKELYQKDELTPEQEKSIKHVANKLSKK